MTELQAEIYSYKLVIDLTDYISQIDFDFDGTDICYTFSEITGYPLQAFHSIDFNKADNRLWVEVYFQHQVESIFKELETLNVDWFKFLLQQNIEKADIPTF